MHFCALIGIAHASAAITGIFHETWWPTNSGSRIDSTKVGLYMDCGRDHGLKSGPQ